ncbi:ABC transporter permease [Streptomyces sp. H10-C2]|uniref:FtsX-like permease family protein n=1 Tax=unclassified Streptomyces TaxID=2593676 RepID=UPI0024BAB000|nr:MULTISPECIES: ABC transporter permease [unclassified Streptomyces]MDJ0340073.1 ABC transporter permease [Streptomyces sp. PH10-H1]MDJ0369290.1 ABC transporter permease [Streptomyces sp. H10-C2]
MTDVTADLPDGTDEPGRTDAQGAPRAPGKAGASGGSGPGGVSWVRVRLRAAPAAAIAMALLVLVTAFLAAALPRAVDRYENKALRDSITESKLRDRTFTLTKTTSSGDFRDMAPGEVPFNPAALASVDEAFQKLVRPPLRLVPGQSVLGVRTGGESAVLDPGLPRPTKTLPPKADLVAQQGLERHARMLSGSLPSGPAVPDASGKVTRVDAAITERTAKVMGLRTGSEIHLSTLGPPLVVHVTGVVAPNDPGSPYWNEDPDLLTPVLASPPPAMGEEPTFYWHFTALIAPEAGSATLSLSRGATLYWHHPVDGSRLTPRDVAPFQQLLASFDTGPDSVKLQETAGFVHVTTGLGRLLTMYDRDRTAALPLVLVAAIGVGATAFAVLLMAGGLAAERRRGELTLLRARGGSLRGMGARLLGETAAAAVPAAIAGIVLAFVLLPTDRYLLSLLLGATVAAAASLALPLRAIAVHRRPRPAAREDVSAARPSRRRTVAELTVTVLVIGAVVALRRRGTISGADPFLASAPVLVAIAAALILLRLYPLPLRLLARPAARLTGAVTHLGLARAGRSPASAQLPLLALLMSLTVASFGGSVLAGVADGRDEAARAAVGADARIDANFVLPEKLAEKVRQVPGVAGTYGVRVEPSAATTGFGMSYSLISVDPAAYARLTRSIGLPGFPADALAHDDGHGPMPAVVSPDIAAKLAGGTGTVEPAIGTTEVRAAAVLDLTPAAPNADFVIVSSAQLTKRHPGMVYSQYTGPTVLLATADGPIDGKALRAAVTAAGTNMFVTTLGEQRAALSDSPLQAGARGIYLAAVAGGAGYSALALLLSLLQAAPQRTALLARLRTMGMSRRDARRLLFLEMLPQALLAAIGGVLVGLAAIPLLGPGVDITALAFGSDPSTTVPAGLGLRVDPLSLALPSAGLLVLACAVLLAQVWVTGRRRESTDLRVGDRA